MLNRLLIVLIVPFINNNIIYIKFNFYFYFYFYFFFLLPWKFLINLIVTAAPDLFQSDSDDDYLYEEIPIEEFEDDKSDTEDENLEETVRNITERRFFEGSYLLPLYIYIYTIYRL